MNVEKATLELEFHARKWRGPILFGLLVLGAILRLYHLTHGWGSHPDERHMVMVAEKLSFSNLNPESFAYGSFPYYLLWLVSSAASLAYSWLATYDGLFVVGRSICVAFGLLGIWLVYLLGRRVCERESIGLLAAALLSLNVFHLQLSRFYTVDVVLTTLSSAALLVAVKLASSWNIKYTFSGGVLIGLAAATKISALSLLLPFFVAYLLYCARQRAFLSLKTFAAGLVLIVAALLAFAIAEPYAFLDSARFLEDIREQTNMVKGLGRPPYVIQYAHTAPYFYHLKQMWFYTMGWPLALSAFAGTILAVFRQIRRRQGAELVLLAFIIGTFLAIGGYQVKFPRYLIPLYPPLFVFAAQILLMMAGVGGVEQERQTASKEAGRKISFVKLGKLAHSLRPRGSSLKAALAVLGLALFIYVIRETFVQGPFVQEPAPAGAGFDEPDRDEPALDMFTGGRGQRLGRFQTARDLCVCDNGQVVVPDSNNHRIQVFDASGTFIRTWGEKGDGPGQFNEPHSVVCAPDGTIYVLDSWNGRVQAFTSDGRFLAALKAEGGMFGPRGFSLKAGLLYVVDSGHAQVIVMDTAGQTLRMFGKRGVEAGQFMEPVGIAVDSRGNIWVVDSGNNRLQVLSPDGKPLNQIPVPGWTGDSLKEAYLDFDGQDNLYLADPVSGDILRLRKDTQEFEKVAPAHSNMRGLAVRARDVLVTVDNQVVLVQR